MNRFIVAVLALLPLTAAAQTSPDIAYGSCLSHKHHAVTSVTVHSRVGDRQVVTVDPTTVIYDPGYEGCPAIEAAWLASPEGIAAQKVTP